MNDSSQFSSSIDKATFSVARRGYAKKEVRAFLDEVEVAFTDLERHAHDTSERIGDLERQLESMKAAESKTMDNALYSVFDAKDRILDKAHRRAEKVESRAQERAAELVEEAERNLVASRAGRGPGGGETSAEVIADAHADAARIREDAARFAATVSDGDVETIAEELAKSRADLIVERARADKAEETAHRKGQELNDLLRDASEAESAEDFSEARSHGVTIVAQAQEEAESILQRARDEANTVRELARKEGDRATAVAAMRELAYDTDPAAALVAARSKIDTLEAELAVAPGLDDATDSDPTKELSTRLVAAEAELLDAREGLESTAALQQDLETAADVESSLRGELAEAKSAVETLEQSLSDSHEGAERVKETGAERVEEMESEISAAAVSLEAVRAELATAAETNVKVGELESALTEMTTTADHLRAGLEESSAAVGSTEERNADLEGRLAAALADSKSLEAVRAELVEALDAAGKLNAAETEIVELTAALDDLRTEVTAMSEAVDLADGRATVAATDRDKAGHAAAELDERESSLATAVANFEETREELAAEKVSLSDAWARLDGERETTTAARKRVDLAAAEAETVLQTGEKRDEHQKQLESDVAGLSAERDALATRRVELEENAAKLVEENERAASAVAAAEEREAALADLLKESEQTQAALTESLEEVASEHDQVVAALDSRILDMKAAVADIQGERDAFAQANTALEAKVGQLQDRAHDPTPAADTADSEMPNTSEIPEDVSDSPVDAATGELVETPFVRGRSRYERNSAKLPRIGDQGKSVLESMRNLRASMTDK